MKLIIFGATGGTGIEIATQALEKGHEVTAFARTPEKFPLKHQNLSLIKGDVLDKAAVEQAIQGQEAVLCALGMPATNRQKLRAKGTKNIILAMETVGVSRFICESGLGCGDSHALLPFHYKYLIFPLILRHVYADHELQESYIRESSLNWTIARPAALTDGKQQGIYWQGFTTNQQTLTMKISRADVADFMLKQLVDDHYLHQAPSLSY